MEYRLFFFFFKSEVVIYYKIHQPQGPYCAHTHAYIRKLLTYEVLSKDSGKINQRDSRALLKGG